MALTVTAAAAEDLNSSNYYLPVCKQLLALAAHPRATWPTPGEAYAEGFAPGQSLELSVLADHVPGCIDMARLPWAEMLKQKQAGLPPTKEAPSAPPATVVNLMDALRRSIQAERPAEKKGKAAEKLSRQSGKRKAG
jgi:hypothetical protein